MSRELAPVDLSNGPATQFGADKDRALAAYDPQGIRDVTELAHLVAMDATMIEPERFVAVSAHRKGLPAYHYRFGYKTEVLSARWARGAPHAAELAYVFNTVAPYYGPAKSATDLAVGNMVNSYWANFVKTGNPNGPGLANWPTYDPLKDRILMFRGDGTAQEMVDPWQDRLNLTAAVADATKP